MAKDKKNKKYRTRDTNASPQNNRDRLFLISNKLFRFLFTHHDIGPIILYHLAIQAPSDKPFRGNYIEIHVFLEPIPRPIAKIPIFAHIVRLEPPLVPIIRLTLTGAIILQQYQAILLTDHLHFD
jgi:hypothetical protein